MEYASAARLPGSSAGGPVGLVGDVKLPAVLNSVRTYVGCDHRGSGASQRPRFGGALTSGSAGYHDDLAGQGARVARVVEGQVALRGARHGGQGNRRE
jgi:hypothetical protein